MSPQQTSGADSTITRRRLLGGIAGVTLGTAGCIGGSGSSGTPSLATPYVGAENASVTVAVYEDFACPNCRQYALNSGRQLINEYAEPGIIRYEHHDFPLPVDPQASWEAASAAREVQRRKGREAFYAYTVGLYENQSQLGETVYRELANVVEADGEAVAAAATNRKFQGAVEADKQRGEDLGVERTPTVFVNGTSVTPRYQDVSAAIEQARDA